VTAAHVLFDRNTGNLLSDGATLTWHSDRGTNDFYSEMHLNLKELATNNLVRFHSTHDVTVIGFANLTSDGLLVTRDRFVTIKSNGIYPITTPLSSCRKLVDINVGDDIYLFGYPGSVGLQQSPKFDYHRPLLRKGIISGVYPQAQTIVVDAAVYFGKSGGPVLEKQDVQLGVTVFKIIGIASEIIPFVDVWENKRYQYSNVNISNSGYAVIEPIDFALDLLWEN
jgi:hypothetical protein